MFSVLIKLPGKQVGSGEGVCATTDLPVVCLELEARSGCRRGEGEGKGRAEAEVTTPSLVPM